MSRGDAYALSVTRSIDCRVGMFGYALTSASSLCAMVVAANGCGRTCRRTCRREKSRFALAHDLEWCECHECELWVAAYDVNCDRC